MDRRAIGKAADVCDLLLDLISRKPSKFSTPYDELPYAEAVIRWEDNGCKKRDFFTTDDPFLLFYRGDIVAKFKLRILTEAEAVVEREYGSISIFRVTGFPEFSDRLN